MSIEVTFTDGRCVAVRPGESVLDACRRSAVPITFSCAAGVCHTCMFKAVRGHVPASAQAGLPAQLRERNYVLACRCVPEESMLLAEPDPADRSLAGMLHDVEQAGPFLYVKFEVEREPQWQPGDRLRVTVRDGGVGFEAQVTGAPAGNFTIEALCETPAVDSSLLLSLPFGTDIDVRGPLEAHASDPELEAPPTDPALWAELAEGAVVESVLQAFYREVYQDPLLAPFFEGVTLQRSVEKQFSFLKQLMTGERVYFGDRPRNAHHWMVISGELFEHRQALMRAHLLRQGLTESQVARWTRLEVHWRRDIVKSAPWPRRVGGVELPVDGYGEEVLSEGTLCDHCSSELAPGTRVQYHLRLGTVSCPDCGSAS